MKSINEIRIYEMDGKDLPPNDIRYLKVVSHWNRKRVMVVVELEGVAVTVPADDLRRAVDNATNNP